MNLPKRHNYQIWYLAFFLVSFVFSCKKSANTSACINHHLSVMDSACNLIGTRMMHGYEYDIFSSGLPDTTYEINNRAITINTTSQNYLKIDNYTLIYNRSLSNDSELYYSIDTTTSGVYKTDKASLVYYFLKDSISYSVVFYSLHEDAYIYLGTY